MQQKCDAIIAKGALWSDPEFNGWTALVADDEEENTEAFNETMRSGVWKRARKVFPDCELFGDEISPLDIE